MEKEKEKGIKKIARKLPTRKNFQCVIKRFRRTGSVKIKKQVKEITVTPNENIEKVRKLVEGNVGMFLNQMSVDVFYPYRIHLTTELTDQQKKVRLDYNKGPCDFLRWQPQGQKYRYQGLSVQGTEMYLGLAAMET